MLLHHLGVITAKKAMSGALQSCQTPGVFPSAQSVGLEVKRWAGLSGPVAVSFFVLLVRRKGRGFPAQCVCREDMEGRCGDLGGQGTSLTAASPLKAGGQTEMIEPTFDNSFGPCPQWLWDP